MMMMRVGVDDDADADDNDDGDDGGDSGDGVVGGNDGQMLALMFNQSILSPIPDELLDVLIICTFVNFYVIFDNFIIFDYCFDYLHHFGRFYYPLLSFIIVLIICTFGPFWTRDLGVVVNSKANLARPPRREINTFFKTSCSVDCFRITIS